MGRKGKTQKHTAKEIAGKHKAAKERAGAAGHGAKGLATRQEKMGKIKVKCSVCLTEQPHLAGMRNHYESKHPKETWSDSLYEGQFASVKADAKASDKTKTLAKDQRKPAAAPAKKKKDDLSLLEGY